MNCLSEGKLTMKNEGSMQRKNILLAQKLTLENL